MSACEQQCAADEQVYVEVAYPRYARWVIVGESPARDGWVFAREVSTGQVLSFAPGLLRPHEPRDDAPAPTIHSSWQRPWSR